MTRMQGNDQQQEWLTLDNAARIYPAALAERSPDVYRVSVTLEERIRASTLERALRAVFPRFPYFQVHLRRGLFWYYLQRDEEIPEIHPLGGVPVSVMPGRPASGHLLRVRAGGKTIAVDFWHVLTDGTGAVRFLGTLATQYLRLRGVRITSWEPFLDPEEPPSPGEYEDAYSRFFDRSSPGPAGLSPAYHLPETPQSRYRIISGRTSVGEMLDLARSHGVSLTEYLVAAYMHALAEIRASDANDKEGDAGSVLRIEVPVDMRRFFPTQTMRNFSLYVSPELDLRLGPYTFDEIVHRVHHSMTLQVDRRELGRQMARNVRAQRNPLIRIMPLFLKDLAFSYVRRRMGERPYSGVLSNLGRIAVPEEITPHIQGFAVMVGPNPRRKKACVTLSFGDDLFISFGSVIETRELERLFFAHLVRAGVRVKVSERSSENHDAL
jgi:hypothetical protein